MITHWIPYDARSGPQGTTAAICGAWVTNAEYSTTPTCPLCVQAIADEEALLETLRTMPAAERPAHVLAFNPTAGYRPKRKHS